MNKRSNKPMYEISGNSEKSRLFGERPEREERRMTFSKVLCIFSDLILAYCLFLTSYSIFKYFDVLTNVNLYVDMGYSTQPDLSYLAYLLPAAFVFAGLTHTFIIIKNDLRTALRSGLSISSSF